MILALSKKQECIMSNAYIPIIKNDNKYYKNISNKNNWHYDNERDYSDFDWDKLYANNF